MSIVVHTYNRGNNDFGLVGGNNGGTISHIIDADTFELMVDANYGGVQGVTLKKEDRNVAFFREFAFITTPPVEGE